MKNLFLILILLTLFLRAKCQTPLTWQSESYKLTTEQLIKSYPPYDSLYRNHKYSNFHYNTSELSFLGNYQLALTIDYAFAFKKNDTVWKQEEIARIKKESEGYSPTLAKDYILSRTKEKQIVVINEAHTNPMHRVFTTSLLKGLYDQGFRYLALEALGEDSLLNLSTYPLKSQGGYTNDPQFGSMIREAIHLGYKFIAYEYGGDDWQTMREKGQALNIKAILDKNPKAKILVHCGYGHGNTDTTGGNKLMGAYLQELTGIKLLNIDQVSLSEHPNHNYETSAYLAFNASYPAVFINKDQKVFGEDSTNYITVYHPPAKYKNGRPDWLFDADGRTYYFIPKKKLKTGYPLIALAFPFNEDSSKAVPADIIELVSENDRKAFVLKPGRYNIILRGSGGQESSFNTVIK